MSFNFLGRNRMWFLLRCIAKTIPYKGIYITQYSTYPSISFNRERLHVCDEQQTKNDMRMHMYLVERYHTKELTFLNGFLQRHLVNTSNK